jgi:hypothetical protein
MMDIRESDLNVVQVLSVFGEKSGVASFGVREIRDMPSLGGPTLDIMSGR